MSTNNLSYLPDTFDSEDKNKRNTDVIQDLPVKMDSDFINQKLEDMEGSIKKRPAQPTLSTTNAKEENDSSKEESNQKTQNIDLIAIAKDWVHFKDKQDGIEKVFIAVLVLIFIRAAWIAFH